MMAYSGDRDGGLKVLNEWSGWLPTAGESNTRGSWWMLALVIEGLVVLDERLRAGELYQLAGELLGSGASSALADCALYANHRRNGGRGWWTMGERCPAL
jgi:hypothetical protein